MTINYPAQPPHLWSIKLDSNLSIGKDIYYYTDPAGVWVVMVDFTQDAPRVVKAVYHHNVTQLQIDGPPIKTTQIQPECFSFSP